MKYIFSLLLIGVFAATAFAQNITNVDAYQNGKQVYITYTLDKNADITIYLSSDGGNTYSAALNNVSGDVGKNVASGNKTAVWDVLADRDRFVGDNFRFKVKASSGGNKTFTVGGVRFEMIYVEGGTFTMGCTSEQGSDCFDRESPSHRVTLSDYYIGKFEVTQELWRAVMGSDPSELYFKGCDECPVENVSWNDIQVFLQKLNVKTGKRFRLPTEAEWEFAARGGNNSSGYKYSGSNTIGNVGWYTVNSYDKGSSHPDYGTHPVGQKTPNELGIYDMSGNVYEWCQDWYGSYSSGSQTNPTGPSFGSSRVLRGGSWDYYAGDCRVSFRFNCSPVNRNADCGFRVVLLP